MTFSADDIKSLIADFHASNWEEMEIRAGDMSVVISRSGNAEWMTNRTRRSGGRDATPSSEGGGRISVSVDDARGTAPTTPAVPIETPVQRAVAQPATGCEVVSPTVGLFWRSPQPGTPPFIDVGQRVDAGETVCIIEVMKLMNQVKAETAGTVVSIEVENGVMVEHGTVLMLIEPDA